MPKMHKKICGWCMKFAHNKARIESKLNLIRQVRVAIGVKRGERQYG